MSRKVFFILLMILVLSFSSCEHHRVDAYLIEIDSMLEHEQTDSAIRQLAVVDISNLSKEDRAYYCLLKTIADYKAYMKFTSDSSINYSIAYYKQVGDLKNLARSYIYKGCVLYDLERRTDMVMVLKEAEDIADGLNDYDLKFKAHIYLSYINAETGNIHKALDYSKRAIKEAEAMGSKRWIGYCLDHMGAIYMRLKMVDSSHIYIFKARPYIEYQPKKEQPYMLNNQGLAYWRMGNLREAEKYFMQSISVMPTKSAYAYLGALYTRQNKIEEGEKFWNKAFEKGTLEDVPDLMSAYSEWLYKQGRKEEAWDVAMKIPPLKDTLMLRRQAETVKEMQGRHDMQLAEIRYQELMEWSAYGIMLLLMVLVMGWLYYHLKAQRTKKQLAEDQLLIQQYEQKVAKLSAADRAQRREMKELRRKIEEVRARQAEILGKGKERFDELMKGGTTARWYKSDIMDCLEYYRTQDISFMVHLEQDYQSLSAGNKLFLLLYHLGFDDEGVKNVMSLSDGAWRTIRSRIKQRGQADEAA